MTDVVIAAARRTAVGSFMGSFANVPAHALGAEVVRAALADASVDGAEVGEVILGQVPTSR
ncbi:MAG: acetyl-CoA C-acetyltransferase, partial [Sphingomonadaceae bacterium]